MAPELGSSWPASLEKARFRLPLLAAGAILGVLAYPRVSWDLLIWVSLVPVFACALARTPRQALADGWVHGLIFFTLLLSWLDHTFRNFSRIPWPLTWLPILGLASYCAFYTGLVGAGVSWISRRRGTGWALAAAPFLWISGEWVRGNILSGFPWGLLGYSQAFVLPVIQIAEWTGVYGVSFLIASMNAGLAGVVVLGWRRALGAVAGAAALLVLSLIIGASAPVAASGGSVRVAVVQPSIDQARKWDPLVLAQTLDIFRDLTVRAGKSSPALLIWPETAVPLLLRHEPAVVSRLRALATEVRAPLVVGAVDVQAGPAPRYFNSAFFLSERGIEGKYDKMHLVPFGEYVPLARVLGFVRSWGEFISEFESGSLTTIFPLREAPFGVVICYEGLFPDLFRQFVVSGAGFMVNITNDAWFGETSGPWQHLAVLPFRAVENRVAIARAANTGVSALIEPSGQISRSIDLFQRGVLEDRLSVRSRTTFYSRHGDIFAFACLGLSLAGVAWAGAWRVV